MLECQPLAQEQPHARIWEHVYDDVASAIGFLHTRTSAKASCMSSITQVALRGLLVFRSFKTAFLSSVSEIASECLATLAASSLRAGCGAKHCSTVERAWTQAPSTKMRPSPASSRRKSRDRDRLHQCHPETSGVRAVGVAARISVQGSSRSMSLRPVAEEHGKDVHAALRQVHDGSWLSSDLSEQAAASVCAHGAKGSCWTERSAAQRRCI